MTEDINTRLRTYQTSDPKRGYKVEFYVFHPDCYEAEKRIKETMKRFASSQRNEWYECDITTARIRLQEQIDDYKEGLYGTQPRFEI